MKMSGAACLIVYGLLFAILNSLVKFLSDIPPHQIVLVRSIVTVGVTYLAIRKAGLEPLGRNKPMLLLRGLAGTAFVLLFYWALQIMPLASATALHYTFPIMTVALGGLFLKEHPTRLQWLLFGVAFFGVLIVRGFDPHVTPLGVFLALASAVAVACALTVIRKLRNEEHPLVVMLYFPMVGIVLLGPWTAFHWVQPKGIQWAVLILTGVLTQLTQYFLTLAYSRDSAANIGNLNYLTIVYSVAIGTTFFGESVTPMALLGMGIIVLAAVLSSKAQAVLPAPSLAPVPRPVVTDTGSGTAQPELQKLSAQK